MNIMKITNAKPIIFYFKVTILKCENKKASQELFLNEA